jgi:hypothetical protein
LQTARKHLTPAGYALLLSQWNQYKKYTVVQTASQEIYVNLLPSELTKSKAAAEGKHIGQTYFRTRKLQTWIDGSGHECISYSRAASTTSGASSHAAIYGLSRMGYSSYIWTSTPNIFRST